MIKQASFLLLLLTLQSCQGEALCELKGSAEQVKINHIVDGDTIKLTDGRTVRLIGINTPELGYAKQANQPLAKQAKQFVEAFFPDRNAFIQWDKEQKDKHGRWLGYAYNSKGQNLEEALLKKGFGFHVAITPNLRHAHCLAQTESRAKEQSVGVWQQHKLSSFQKLKPGYRRITGRVKTVDFSKNWLIYFDDDALKQFIAVIKPDAQKHFKQNIAQNWIGKKIEIEGWVYPMGHKPTRAFGISISSAFSVSLIKNQ